jgi:dTDP-4-amino-4,6-dideoxygalactose transaminase
LQAVKQVKLPPPPATGGPFFDVFQNYEIEAEDRDELVKYLKDIGIETIVPWGGKVVHQFSALGLENFRLPRTEEMIRKVVMLPMYSELTDAEVEMVTESVKSFFS